MRSTALIAAGPDQIGRGPVELPAPATDEVLVTVRYSAISPGTEMRCLAGKQGRLPPFPFIPGYSAMGTVTGAGPDSGLDVGQRVFASGTQHANLNLSWGGHCAHLVVRGADCVPLPDAVPDEQGVLLKLAAIAWHGCRRGAPLAHEKVTLLGLGLIGQLSARCYAASGCHLVCADPVPARVERARAAGLTAEVVGDDLTAVFAPHFPDGADVVVDCTGANPVLAQGIQLTRDKPWDDSYRPGARYVIQGSYAGSFSIPHHEAFQHELDFILPRDEQPRDRHAVLDLVTRGVLDLRGLATRILSPDEAPAFYEQLRNREGNDLTALVRWSD